MTQPPRKKILIVEDEGVLLRALAETLQRFYTIIRATNGKDGLRLAKASQPDLILLDILIPQMDGMTMLKVLRHYPWGRSIPVIVFTNMSHPGWTTEAKRYGATEFLTKSHWTLTGILRRVQAQLGDKRLSVVD